MASVEKFTAAAVRAQLRHIERETQHPANSDIDPARLSRCYALHTHTDTYGYYKRRLAQLSYLHRTDVKTMAGWVVTAPEEVPPEAEPQFFGTVYNFLRDRYGAENVVAAVVHGDEAGRPHLHFCFIPETGGRVCAKQVLDRDELRSIHGDLQDAITAAGMPYRVKTGVTKANGGNRRVRELKAEREQERRRDRWTRVR